MTSGRSACLTAPYPAAVDVCHAAPRPTAVVAPWRPMVQAALAFLPFAAFLAVLPGPATAMVVQSAARGGRAHALRATLGDAAGLALWAVASMLGVLASAVARAREAFVRHRAKLQAATGTLMVGFGLKVLADQR
jgi:threonine/homoserine/homoserine lactone efflux protein